jgi:16S rRNA (uracil1498-N3)-methyltransferase
VAARLSAATAAFVLHEEATERLTTASLPFALSTRRNQAEVIPPGAQSKGAEVVLVVGPEGGISEAELEAFGAAGATAVRLGDSVLRTSTAGVAALSVLSVRLGRW